MIAFGAIGCGLAMWAGGQVGQKQQQPLPFVRELCQEVGRPA